MDFCMRLALIDTLFEHEQPFMILDDPFVNLDEEHLSRALELLSAMSATRQIVYFVCHPVRAVKTGISDRDKEAFRELAENAKKTLEQRMDELLDHAPKQPVSLLDRYIIEAPQESLPFVLENPDFVIRETVFPMAFRIKGGGIHPDRLYELFFIDGYGHVVSDHRLMELRNERLCPSELQFSLNAGPKNGTKFALMVRESGSDDFDITAAIPFDGELKAA